VRSKADTSQLNLPHGTDNGTVENRKIKNKKRICSEVSVNSQRGVRREAEKEGYAVGTIYRKGGFKRLS